jgi:hypothetical protein
MGWWNNGIVAFHTLVVKEKAASSGILILANVGATTDRLSENSK